MKEGGGSVLRAVDVFVVKKAIIEKLDIVASPVDSGSLLERPVTGVVLKGHALDFNVALVVNVEERRAIFRDRPEVSVIQDNSRAYASLIPVSADGSPTSGPVRRESGVSRGLENDVIASGP